MASVGMAHNQVEKGGANSMFVDKLPEGVNEMTIKDDKVKKVAAFFFSRSLLLHLLGLGSIFSNKLFIFLLFVGNGGNNGRWKWDGNWSYYCYNYQG